MTVSAVFESYQPAGGAMVPPAVGLTAVGS